MYLFSYDRIIFLLNNKSLLLKNLIMYLAHVSKVK